MRVRLGIATAGALLAVSGFILAGFVVSGAAAHSSPCHSAHTCPSDHHTYVWIDPSTGRGWDCAQPGAPEYDPTRDTTTIVWDGRTSYCRAASPTETTTTAPEPTVPETNTLTATTATETTTTSTTSTTTTTTPTPQLVLPDPALTPGKLNPKVRQATIKRTICESGWTKTIRPPTSYTNKLKVKQMVLYGETGSPSDYEEDHFIPLELGGAPKSPKNLWPEPHSQSKLSDPLETKLKRLVCKGILTLKKARAAIRKFKNEIG